MWQAVAYSSPLHKVRFLHLTIRKATIVSRDARVTKAFTHGSRHTYLACPSLGKWGWTGVKFHRGHQCRAPYIGPL